MRRTVGMLITAAALTTVVIAAGTGSAASPSVAQTAASPRCHTADLTVRDVIKNGAAGSVVDKFKVKNVSGHTCHTRGFAGLTLISRLGNVLPTHVSRDGTSHRVSLGSGRSAHFLISFHVVDLHHGGASCHSHTARSLRVIPPDETDSLLVTLRDEGITPCHGKVSEKAITR